MVREHAAHPLPLGFIGREDERAGGIDIKSMNDARTKAAFAHAHDFRVTRDDRIQHRVLLIGTKRMHAASRRLVHDDEAIPLGNDFQIQITSRRGRLIDSLERPLDFEALTLRRRMGLVGETERSIAQPDSPDFQEMSHARPGNLEPIGEKAVERSVEEDEVDAMTVDNSGSVLIFSMADSERSSGDDGDWYEAFLNIGVKVNSIETCGGYVEPAA